MGPRNALLASAFGAVVACGTNVDLGGSRSGSEGGADSPSPTCPGYAAPSTRAHCFACSGMGCQPNGCYGGYYCRTATDDCQPPAVACGAAPVDAGFPE